MTRHACSASRALGISAWLAGAWLFGLAASAGFGAEPPARAKAPAAAVPAPAAAVPDTKAAPEPGPATDASKDVIQMHVGIPGTIFLGQPLTDVLAHFPGVKKVPFANQPQVVQLQIPEQGISALAMGETPASMTVESIGFNFAETYEGVSPGANRTVEGIGTGSNVNELLEAYGKPAESGPEAHRAAVAPVTPAPGKTEAPERIRHLYRSEDGQVATYFIVEGSRVLRMAMSRPASVQRYVVRPPAGGAPPAKP
ncbi:MAG TPA: hypothetical protein VFC25_01110 [Verrucomicrobiae bacterium]|nr:hypothetical protein [Verrucomicrobiae bacterium]